MSESEEEIQTESNKRKKGIVRGDSYRRNIIKKAKVKGQGYVNWAGKSVEGKTPGSTNCR